MKKWTFEISYQSRGVVIEGRAIVSGDYDGPSKPLAMVRSVLAGAQEAHPYVRVTLLEGPEAAVEA